MENVIATGIAEGIHEHEGGTFDFRAATDTDKIQMVMTSDARIIMRHGDREYDALPEGITLTLFPPAPVGIIMRAGWSFRAIYSEPWSGKELARVHYDAATLTPDW